MSDEAARRRERAIARLKTVVPLLFVLGFLFYAAITVYPLAGMPGEPIDPLDGIRPFLLWVAVSSACGGLFALFGGLVVAVSGASDEAAS